MIAARFLLPAAIIGYFMIFSNSALISSVGLPCATSLFRNPRSAYLASRSSSGFNSTIRLSFLRLNISGTSVLWSVFIVVAEVPYCKCANDFIAPCHRWSGSILHRLAHRQRSRSLFCRDWALHSVHLAVPIWFSVLPPGGMTSVPRPLHFRAEPKPSRLLSWAAATISKVFPAPTTWASRVLPP